MSILRACKTKYENECLVGRHLGQVILSNILEQTGCLSTVQPIPAQTGGPSQAGPGGLLFTNKITLNVKKKSNKKNMFPVSLL